MISHLLVSMLLFAEPAAQAEAGDSVATSVEARPLQLRVGVETLGGVMLFSSLNPYSFGVQPGWSFGASASLNFGQVLAVGSLPLEFAAELRWLYSKSSRVAQPFIFDVHHQALTVAPSLALRLGANSPWLIFAQLGAGAEVVTVNAAAENNRSSVGARALFQYGGGLRFAPAMAGPVGLTLRLEIMRVHQDLPGDTWVGLGAGVKF